MSQRDLAAVVRNLGGDVSESALRDWESGKSKPRQPRSETTLDQIFALERALHIPTGELYLFLETNAAGAGHAAIGSSASPDARMTTLAELVRGELTGSDQYAVVSIDKHYRMTYRPGQASRTSTRITQVIRALADGVNRSAFIHTVHVTSEDSLIPVYGCSVMRRITHPEILDGNQRMVGVALSFERTLNRSDYHTFTFEVVEEGAVGIPPEPRVRHLQRTACEHLSLHLTFVHCTRINSLSEKRWHIKTLRDRDAVRVEVPEDGTLDIDLTDVGPWALGWDWRWQE